MLSDTIIVWLVSALCCLGIWYVLSKGGAPKYDALKRQLDDSEDEVYLEAERQIPIVEQPVSPYLTNTLRSREEVNALRRAKISEMRMGGQ